MTNRKVDRVDVIATTISGSIKDWKKIPQIKPLFEQHFPEKVNVHIVDSHEAARQAATKAVNEGSKTLISAGGAGTFNRVVQGILDNKSNLEDLRVGFLRKGSADLIGKALGVPDGVEKAIAAISRGIKEDRVVHCDVIHVSEQGIESEGRNFLGFGGIGIIGDIPFYTDNPWTKYYKGILGMLFGDLGPFRVGTSLALSAWVGKKALGLNPRFQIVCDGEQIPGEKFISLLLISGDLGPDMPFGRGLGLGKGCFYSISLRDKGVAMMIPQAWKSFNGDILKIPDRWGLDIRVVRKNLSILPLQEKPCVYRVNIDGLKWATSHPLDFTLKGKLRLISGR